MDEYLVSRRFELNEKVPSRPINSPALIALQAGVYRYSEAVDLASRLVENATSALKTVIQGQ